MLSAEPGEDGAPALRYEASTGCGPVRSRAGRDMELSIAGERRATAGHSEAEGRAFGRAKARRAIQRQILSQLVFRRAKKQREKACSAFLFVKWWRGSDFRKIIILFYAM